MKLSASRTRMIVAGVLAVTAVVGAFSLLAVRILGWRSTRQGSGSTPAAFDVAYHSDKIFNGLVTITSETPIATPDDCARYRKAFGPRATDHKVSLYMTFRPFERGDRYQVLNDHGKTFAVVVETSSEPSKDSADRGSISGEATFAPRVQGSDAAIASGGDALAIHSDQPIPAERIGTVTYCNTPDFFSQSWRQDPGCKIPKAAFDVARKLAGIEPDPDSVVGSRASSVTISLPGPEHRTLLLLSVPPPSVGGSYADAQGDPPPISVLVDAANPDVPLERDVDFDRVIAVADLDGDGVPELVVDHEADWELRSFKDGQLGPAVCVVGASSADRAAKEAAEAAETIATAEAIAKAKTPRAKECERYRFALGMGTNVNISETSGSLTKGDRYQVLTGNGETGVALPRGKRGQLSPGDRIFRGFTLAPGRPGSVAAVEVGKFAFAKYSDDPIPADRIGTVKWCSTSIFEREKGGWRSNPDCNIPAGMRDAMRKLPSTARRSLASLAKISLPGPAHRELQLVVLPVGDSCSDGLAPRPFSVLFDSTKPDEALVMVDFDDVFAVADLDGDGSPEFIAHGPTWEVRSFKDDEVAPASCSVSEPSPDARLLVPRESCDQRH